MGLGDIHPSRWRKITILCDRIETPADSGDIQTLQDFIGEANEVGLNRYCHHPKAENGPEPA